MLRGRLLPGDPLLQDQIAVHNPGGQVQVRLLVVPLLPVLGQQGEVDQSLPGTTEITCPLQSIHQFLAQGQAFRRRLPAAPP